MSHRVGGRDGTWDDNAAVVVSAMALLRPVRNVRISTTAKVLRISRIELLLLFVLML